ncbi:hypothetical protein A2853_03195 [Candidatus Kaiserbacteria bacterium RIFCSPHIGHO2_01_FULL_55_17]|uniref:AB hydrolase-1 domain-containing protein n=1 Tax=Candidatus Kaiserbacteria bacterium RIFCSPHIGHO2_01_FULL_55_17 TaxID=1798484 RepID=A0A1F6D987_9BACT|nr:MAG: hypothetical protein A2853_03195 [Candidatus Kaiserbacteria bacterium RIFCSPHIGHO2_01_FULL_55_17]
MQESFFGERGLYYRMSELRTDRPTLLLLHGLSGSSSVWLPYEKKLESSYNILSLDLRGHGESRRWSKYHDYDPSFFADDIRALLEHAGIKSYNLVAHSFGTLVALELLLHESGAQKVLLLSPNYAVHRMLRSRLTRWPLAAIAAIFSRLPSIHWRGEHIDYSKLGFSSDWDYRRLYMDIVNTGIRTYVHCLHHVYSFTRDKDWARISIPTTIVHGEFDSFVPIAHGVELAGIIPQAKFHMLHDANHMLVLNNFEEVMNQIRWFATSDRIG